MRHIEVHKYQSFASKGIRPESEGKDPLVGFALGLAGETGEVVDGIKKIVYHGRTNEITKSHLVEELGDVMWYVANLCTVLDVTLEEVMCMNCDKLRRRYPELYVEDDDNE